MLGLGSHLELEHREAVGDPGGRGDGLTDLDLSGYQGTDKALDWLASQTANQASAETGIIAGFA